MLINSYCFGACAIKLCHSSQVQNTVNQILNILQNQTTCDDTVIQVRQADIPLVITQPGVYCLAEDISLTTSNAITIPAMTIGANKVVIDLNNKTILGSGGDRGIQIIPTLFTLLPMALEIKNGTIAGMREQGIFVVGIAQLLIDNVTLYANGGGGSDLVRGNVTMDTIFNPLIRNSQFYFAGTGALGMSLTNCANLLVDNCVFDANNTEGLLITGGVAFNSGVIRNCVASSNGTNGFQADSGERLIYENCSSEANGASGFNLGDTSLTVLDCQAVTNSVDGFVISSANSFIRNNTATSNVGTGFSISGTDNRVYSNFANDNGTNFSGITNIVLSPLATDAINFTANIEE